jgi:MraZ protein
MFLGEYRQTIEEKGGLLLPSQYSIELASGMVVTRGFDRNLMLFPHHGWQLLAHKILNRPLSNQQGRALRRRFFSNAAVLNADQYGRIQIPASLCDFAGLEGEVVLAGMYDYLEIWNTQTWQPVYDAINSGENGSIWETVGV